MKSVWKQLRIWWQGTDPVAASRLDKLEEQLWALIGPNASRLTATQLRGYVWARVQASPLIPRDQLRHDSPLLEDLSQRFGRRLAAQQQVPSRRVA